MRSIWLSAGFSLDREYLPNGMWDDMCITGASILAEDSGAVDNACAAMEESYKAKLEVQ